MARGPEATKFTDRLGLTHVSKRRLAPKRLGSCEFGFCATLAIYGNQSAFGRVQSRVLCDPPLRITLTPSSVLGLWWPLGQVKG
jgi:hypothetical protein